MKYEVGLQLYGNIYSQDDLSKLSKTQDRYFKIPRNKITQCKIEAVKLRSKIKRIYSQIDLIAKNKKTTCPYLVEECEALIKDYDRKSKPKKISWSS